MTYIKNNCLLKPLLSNITLYKAQSYKETDVSHICMLNSIIYVFLYKEKES